MDENQSMLFGVHEGIRYGIMPYKYFSRPAVEAPDVTGEDIIALGPIEGDFQIERRIRKGKDDTISFENICDYSGQTPTQVKITPAAGISEGERDLVVQVAPSPLGRFYITGSAKASITFDPDTNIADYGFSALWKDASVMRHNTANASGTIAPFHLIIPNLDILTPQGDPTKAAEANSDNEAVFDDSSPGGEAAGSCNVILTKAALDGLAASSRTLVWNRCLFTMHGVGTIAATLNPASQTGQVITATYASMPAIYSDFGPKTITMTFGGSTRYLYYQPIEFFFYPSGTGHPNQTPIGGVTAQQDSPNYFYYYLQEGSALIPYSAHGNIIWSGQAGQLGSDGEFDEATTNITIYLGATDRVVDFNRVVNHEIGHYTNFQTGIYHGAGFGDTWMNSATGGGFTNGAPDTRWDHGGPNDAQFRDLYLTQVTLNQNESRADLINAVMSAAQPNNVLNDADIEVYFAAHPQRRVPVAASTNSAILYSRGNWIIGADGLGICKRNENTAGDAASVLNQNDWSSNGRNKQFK
ncbi:hypothetical protein HY772_04545 [Candidatus Woesearchaeota archaeon]|nr:hypothetical protein [Candidatus Woesearchaeota archaeon]